MIVVKIELWSAITGKVSEIGRMYIANDGTTHGRRGNYDVKVARKGSNPARSWNDIKTTRVGRVEDYARNAYSVWKLVHNAIKSSYPEWK